MPAVLPSSGLSLKKSGKRWKLQSDSQGEHVEQLPETLAPSQVPGPFTHIAERRGGRETRKPKRKTASPEHRAVRDDLGMMRQLGVIPAPANAG